MHFQSILLVLTEQCHVGCQHCGYIGSKRDGEVTPEELASWIDQIAESGIPEIIFTGGEAFEKFSLLEQGVRRAKELHLLSSVFTSSFWATSFQEAKRTLTALEGLTQIYLSTDIYHQKRVPYSNVRHAIDAAIELGIPTIRLNVTYASEQDRLAVVSEYSDYGARIKINCDRVIPNQFVSPKLLAHEDARISLAPHRFGSRCWLGTPLISPQGDLFACHIGKIAAHKDATELPYFLGSLRTASFSNILDIARARRDYQFLRTHGPRGVAEMVEAAPNLLPILPRRTFTNACDMCVSVLTSDAAARQLKLHAQDRIDDINTRLVLTLKEDVIE